MSYIPGGVAAVASRVALDANDRAVFYFDEAAGSTTFVNSGNAAGNLTVYAAGTGCYPKAAGIQGETSAFIGTTCQVRSATSKWEYANFTIHVWVFPLGPITGNNYIVFKNYNTGDTFSDPYQTLNLNLAGGAITTAIGPTVTPGCTVPATPVAAMIPVGVWSHLALTWNGQYLIFYVNGIEVARSIDLSGSSVLYGNHGEWSVGMRPGGTANCAFLVQDLRICDVARSASYLLDVALRGATPQPNNVIF
jgi:hypothetical protein